MILYLKKKNLALYNHIYSWCSYHKGTTSFDSLQSSLFSRFHSFFPAITSWCFFILFIYIFFLRLVWACLSSVRAAVNRFSAQISPRITVTSRLSKPSPVPSQPIQLYILHTPTPITIAMPCQPHQEELSLNLLMNQYHWQCTMTGKRTDGWTDRQTDERTDGRSALPAVDVMVAFADSHQECRRCCGCVAAAHKLWQLKSIN